MIVIVGEHSVELKEPQDLGRLQVFSTCVLAAADAALRSAGLGRIDQDGNARLGTPALHERGVREPEVGTDAGWERRWIGLVRQAMSEGWADEGGAVLVARISSD